MIKGLEISHNNKAVRVKLKERIFGQIQSLRTKGTFLDEDTEESGPRTASKEVKDLEPPSHMKLQVGYKL